MYGVFFIIFLCYSVNGLPARDELVFDDTAIVESTVRETRAAPEHIEELLEPGVKSAYLHTYGDAEGDEGDIQGYSKKSNDKGVDGYKHFDSYHKKDGDKYGFETHSEYGNQHGAEAGGKAQKYTDDESAASDDDGEETRNSYKVVEDGVENDKKRKSAVEDYGFYADGGDSEGYTDGEAESEGYTDGESESEAEDDGELSHYESEAEGGGDGAEEDEGESAPYTSDGDDSGSYTSGYDDYD